MPPTESDLSRVLLARVLRALLSSKQEAMMLSHDSVDFLRGQTAYLARHAPEMGLAMVPVAPDVFLAMDYELEELRAKVREMEEKER